MMPFLVFLAWNLNDAPKLYIFDELSKIIKPLHRSELLERFQQEGSGVGLFLCQDKIMEIF